MLIYLNGKMVPEKRAVISVHDHGFLYGDGVYETLRVYEGQVFQGREHLQRLQHSADGIGLKLPMSLSRMGKAIQKTVRANRLKEAVVRLTVSRGPGAYGFDPRLCKAPTLAIVAFPFKPYPPSFHKVGITIAVVGVRRNNVLSLPPHVKSTSCMNGILAKKESVQMGAQEGVMLTLDGHIAEGTVSNVFIVKRGALLTPKLEGSLLAGVTRHYVCDLAKKSGYRVQEIRLPWREFLSADEIFLTNTTMEVIPIKTILIRQPVGPVIRRKMGPVGPVTCHLMELFTASIQ